MQVGKDLRMKRVREKVRVIDSENVCLLRAWNEWGFQGENNVWELIVKNFKGAQTCRRKEKNETEFFLRR